MAPVWYQQAMGELGETEITGAKHNPRILEYHRATGLKASDDETPWCGSFVAWSLKQADVPYDPRFAARARMWLEDPNFKELTKPIVGAIGVIPRGKAGSSTGHVFFFGGWVDETKERFFALGGNQNGSASDHDGKVTIMKIRADQVLGWRWPKKIDLPMANTPASKSGIVKSAAAVGASGGLVLADKISEAISDGTVDSAAERVESAQAHFSAGTWLGIGLGVLIIGIAIFIIWQRVNGARRDRELAGE